MAGDPGTSLWGTGGTTCVSPGLCGPWLTGAGPQFVRGIRVRLPAGAGLHLLNLFPICKSTDPAKDEAGSNNVVFPIVLSFNQGSPILYSICMIILSKVYCLVFVSIELNPVTSIQVFGLLKSF